MTKRIVLVASRASLTNRMARCRRVVTAVVFLIVLPFGLASCSSVRMERPRLPPDITIIRPNSLVPIDVALLSGVWLGEWRTTSVGRLHLPSMSWEGQPIRAFVIVVEKLAPDRMTGYYCWGPEHTRFGSDQPGCRPVEGEVSGKKAMFTAGRGTVSLTANSDDTGFADWSGQSVYLRGGHAKKLTGLEFAREFPESRLRITSEGE